MEAKIWKTLAFMQKKKKIKKGKKLIFFFLNFKKRERTGNSILKLNNSFKVLI
jgi:hypothetical protein